MVEASYQALQTTQSEFGTLKKLHPLLSHPWVTHGERLLLWVPWQYRGDINDGTRLVIGAHVKHPMSAEVDYRKVFRYSRARWKEIYTGNE